MRFLLASIGILIMVSTASAATRGIVYYFDGARVEGEASAVKGYLEIPLPASYQAGSLRVRPAGEASIVRVEVAPAPANPKSERELKELAERRRSLEDRLRALEVREEIFKAAAKSQSSKAPRKTKTNPEPIETIRKGTDYAVAQLEDVYRARHRAEDGLKSIESRIASLRKDGVVGGSVARVWQTGKGGVLYSYLVVDTGWKPFYDFRLNGGGSVEVTIRAILPDGVKARASVISSRIGDTGENVRAIHLSGNFAPVARFVLPVAHEEVIRGAQRGVRFSFTNSSGGFLSPGEAACYLNGEFIGPVPFAGCKAGETREIVAGRQPPQ